MNKHKFAIERRNHFRQCTVCSDHWPMRSLLSKMLGLLRSYPPPAPVICVATSNPNKIFRWGLSPLNLVHFTVKYGIWFNTISVILERNYRPNLAQMWRKCNLYSISGVSKLMYMGTPVLQQMTSVFELFDAGQIECSRPLNRCWVGGKFVRNIPNSVWCNV